MKTERFGEQPEALETRYVERIEAMTAQVEPSLGIATRVTADQHFVDAPQSVNREPSSLDKLERLFWNLAIAGKTDRTPSLESGDSARKEPGPAMGMRVSIEPTMANREPARAEAPHAPTLPEAELPNKKNATPAGRKFEFSNLFALNTSEKTDATLLAAEMRDIDSNDLLSQGLYIVGKLRTSKT